MTLRAAPVVALMMLASGAPVAMGAAASIDPAGMRIAVGVRSLHEMRFDRLVQQHWDVSCGAAALSTLLTYHLGRPTSEYAIAIWILRDVDPALVRARGGFSLLDLKRFAQALGYEAEGYGGMTVADLAGLGMPAIVPVRIHGLDHFVIVRGIVGGRVMIGDPVFGNLTMQPGQFARLWKSGVAFVVMAEGLGTPAGSALADEIADLRIPDLTGVGRMVRGAGPAPLTRKGPLAP